MSFEVKNIEQENINFSKLFFMAVVLIVTVIASTIFVYYWFTFEKMDVMQQQYLGKESEIKKEHDLNEQKKFNEMEMDAAKEELEKKYLFKYDK
ncbi:MAG: hypothetical protein CMG13_02455 [Candidatus Marinimicrobia bacterium]|nr:hypothetical protein [Candidatus Neomarinimicrobiota bacterium]